jgi:ABC-type dipeptide/oligopeptide/nickel transport system permease subunit
MSWKNFLLAMALSSVVFGYSVKTVVTFVIIHSPYFYTMVRNEAMDKEERDRLLEMMYRSYVRKMSDRTENVM